ncbi:helix-turn-helix domain-containing protein [Paenibacillus cellulosilyticus]|nr:helix-turn-helix domain-containing protein [Paenibacillus cellulosilyticus]QKS45556.1 helix-turn-helix domain-containing protein [Paenibacillus cellulosilyticus]
MKSLTFLSKLTIYGFLLSTLPVLFIGIFSYFTSSNEIQSHVNQGKQQLIRQINSNVEQKLMTVNQTLNQVIHSTVFQKAMKQKLTENDFALYNDLQNEIRYMQSFDTKVEDVILMNERYNWMVKNSGLYPFEQYAHYAELSGLIHSSDNTDWILTPTTWFYSEENTNMASCEYSISLIKKWPSAGLEHYGAAIANIPVCDLQQLVQLDGESNASDSIIIIDSKGLLLLHPDAKLIGHLAADAGLADFGDWNTADGQLRMKLNGSNFAITYHRSDLNNWTYLSATSISSLTSESKKIGMYTATVCFLMLIISIVVAWLSSRRMYSPIERLLTQLRLRSNVVSSGRRANEFQVIGEQMQHLFQSNERLQDEANRHLKQVKLFDLMRAYQGAIKQSDVAERLIRFGYGLQLSYWKTMVVMNVQIDSIDGTRYKKSDMELLQFAVHNMLQELIPVDDRLDPVFIDGTIVTLIGSETEQLKLFKDNLNDLAVRVQEHIATVLSLNISIGHSLPFHSVSTIAVAYREGLEALKHRIHLGEGIIVPYESFSSGKHYLNLTYPTHLENELIDAIKLTEPDKAKPLLNQLMRAIFTIELPPQEYQIPMSRLLNNLLIVMQESGISLKSIHQGNDSLFEEMLDLHIVAEIEDWFWTTVIKPIIGILNDRQNTQYHNLSEKMIELVRRYYDTDLTLEQCAATLHYNANYLSGVFRKETNYSFSEYLAMYRLNMAKKWLAETSMPIKDIAAKLQYNNPQNFIRSFRKAEGITPGQYREKHVAV